ncbi:helix-turn-helix domain-containing protein [Streptomyces sp. NPDC001700]
MTRRQPGSPTLSGREREALQLIANGMSTSQAATEMKVSADTVQGYIGHVVGKLGTGDRASAVHQSYVTGALTPPNAEPAGNLVVTSGQLRVLQGLADGLSQQELAASSGFYTDNVRAEERALTALLGAKSAAHLITCSWQQGWLGPESTRGSRSATTPPVA